jgi:hypothetical protein
MEWIDILVNNPFGSKMTTYNAKVMATAVCILLSQLVGALRGANEAEFIEVSLISLIATPERFDGKLVLVQGISYLDDQHSIYGIYLTRDDKRAGNDKNAVYLILAPVLGKLGRLNDRYVMARGRFRAEVKGHLGAFAGSLDDVDLVREIKLDGVR